MKILYWLCFKGRHREHDRASCLPEANGTSSLALPDGKDRTPNLGQSRLLLQKQKKQKRWMLCETSTGSITTTSGYASIEGKWRISRDLWITTALPHGRDRSAAGQKEAAQSVRQTRTLHHLIYTGSPSEKMAFRYAFFPGGESLIPQDLEKGTT